MKHITLILLTICLVGCVKKTNPVPPTVTPPAQPPTTPVVIYSRFIPNWQRDTLHGQCVDINNDWIYDSNGNQVYDTIVTYSVNDTSFIEHDNTVYYLWWKPAFATDTFENNQQTYVNCQIGTSPDTSASINKYNVGASPYRYWNDTYNGWSPQKQSLSGHNFSKKHDVWGSAYTSIKQ